MAQAELETNENNEEETRVKRQRRIIESKKKPAFIPSTVDIVQAVGKKRKPKDVIISIAEPPLKLFDKKIRISDSHTGIKTIVNGNPYVTIIFKPIVSKTDNEGNQCGILENEDRVIIRLKKHDYVVPVSQKAISKIIKPTIRLGFSDSVYCICRTSQSEGILMILCESCGEWFHLNVFFNSLFFKNLFSVWD